MGISIKKNSPSSIKIQCDNPNIPLHTSNKKLTDFCVFSCCKLEHENIKIEDIHQLHKSHNKKNFRLCGAENGINTLKYYNTVEEGRRWEQ